MKKSYADFLLVSDMDGTLLNSDKVVSAENRAAIADFVAGGGRFAIATGRPAENAAGYLREVPVNSPGIFFNGAILYDWRTAQLLSACPLEGKLWREFAAHCLERFPKACVEVYTVDTCHIVSAPANDDPRLAVEYKGGCRHSSLAETAELEWMKFLLCAPHAMLEEAVEEAEIFGITEVCSHFYSEPEYLEFVARDVSKGHMLEQLRRLPGNASRYVVAAGDYANDDEMLRRADCGIAPANALEATKSAADRIGVDCDDHLWQHIIYEVLPELQR